MYCLLFWNDVKNPLITVTWFDEIISHCNNLHGLDFRNVTTHEIAYSVLYNCKAIVINTSASMPRQTAIGKVTDVYLLTATGTTFTPTHAVSRTHVSQS